LRGIATRALDVAADFDSFADLWDPLVTGDSPLAEYAGSLPRKHLLALGERLRENARPASDGRVRLMARALAVRGYAGERCGGTRCGRTRGARPLADMPSDGTKYR